MYMYICEYKEIKLCIHSIILFDTLIFGVDSYALLYNIYIYIKNK